MKTQLYLCGYMVSFQLMLKTHIERTYVHSWATNVKYLLYLKLWFLGCLEERQLDNNITSNDIFYPGKIISWQFFIIIITYAFMHAREVTYLISDILTKVKNIQHEGNTEEEKNGYVVFKWNIHGSAWSVVINEFMLKQGLEKVLSSR